MIILVILLVLMAVIVIQDIYNSTNHSQIESIDMLKSNAKIIDLKSCVIGTKGHKRIRTTVIFNDGFKYISHITNVENHMLYYSISLSESAKYEIIFDAISAHNKALKKKNKNEDR